MFINQITENVKNITRNMRSTLYSYSPIQKKLKRLVVCIDRVFEGVADFVNKEAISQNERPTFIKHNKSKGKLKLIQKERRLRQTSQLINLSTPLGSKKNKWQSIKINLVNGKGTVNNLFNIWLRRMYIRV